MRLYTRIGAILPKPIVDKFKKQMNYAGIQMPELNLIGFVFSFGLAISIGIALNMYSLFQLPMWATFPLFFFLFAFGIYYWLNTSAENRGRFVEQILPDVLQLVSSNMRAGLTTERALLVSARPEFGVFSEELKFASARVLSGERIEETLNDISKKIKSPVLERTTWLMIQGIRSGGEVADLLTQLADDLREENAMKEEAKAEVSMYVMLIFFAIAFIAPVLLGVSSYIVGMLVEQTQGITNIQQVSEMQRQSIAGRFVGMPTVSITEDFATNFALIALLASCIFGSLLIGVINAGKEMDGVKFIPFITIIAIALFYIVRFLLEKVLGSLKMM